MNRNVSLLQKGGRPYPTQHKNLGRMDRTRSQDNLSSGFDCDWCCIRGISGHKLYTRYRGPFSGFEYEPIDFGSYEHFVVGSIETIPMASSSIRSQVGAGSILRHWVPIKAIFTCTAIFGDSHTGYLLHSVIQSL